MSSNEDKNPNEPGAGSGKSEGVKKSPRRASAGVPNFDHKKGSRKSPKRGSAAASGAGRSGAGKGSAGKGSPAKDRMSRQAARRRGRKHGDDATSKEPATPISPKIRWGVAALLAVAFAWSYFPTMKLLQGEWERLPDYSHGYLVIPFALLLAYLRRDRRPELSSGLSFFGLLLIGAAVAMRWYGDAYYYPVIGSASIPLWVAGAVWLVGGFRTFWWSLPSVAFLFFMIPLPSRFGPMLSGQLQRIATIISTWLLQLIGQPALAEGNTIALGDQLLEVEQACSGLRIFVSILALAFFFIFMVRRPWWQSTLIALSTVPIALAANALRIVFTGVLLQKVSGEAAAKFSHDFAGWVMIPVACLFFVAFLWYLSHVFVRVEKIDLSELRRQKGADSGPSPAPST